MTEPQAQTVAAMIDGEYYHSGGGIWIAYRERRDRTLVVVSDELVGEYACWDAFDAGCPMNEIYLFDHSEEAAHDAPPAAGKGAAESEQHAWQ